MKYDKRSEYCFTCLLPGGCYGLWLLLSGASIIESDYLLLKRPPCWMRPASLSSSIVSSWPQGVNLHVTHKPPESPPPPVTVALLGIFLSLTWYINRSPTPNPPFWSCMWLPSSHSLANSKLAVAAPVRHKLLFSSRSWHQLMLPSLTGTSLIYSSLTILAVLFSNASVV